MDPDVQGGASSALDLTTEKDRGLMRTALTRWPNRWKGMRPELKVAACEGLTKALDDAEQIGDDPGRRAEIRCSVARTVAMIEAQVQKDDHKSADLDQPKAPPPGSPTVQVNVQNNVAAPIDRRTLVAAVLSDPALCEAANRILARAKASATPNGHP